MARQRRPSSASRSTACPSPKPPASSPAPRPSSTASTSTRSHRSRRASGPPSTSSVCGRSRRWPREAARSDGHRRRRRHRLPSAAGPATRACPQRDGTPRDRRARAQPARERQVRRRPPFVVALGAHAVRSAVSLRARDGADPPPRHHLGRRHPPRDPHRQPVGADVEPAAHGGGAGEHRRPVARDEHRRRRHVAGHGAALPDARAQRRARRRRTAHARCARGQASRRGRLHPRRARDRRGRDDGGHGRARPRCHRDRVEGPLRGGDGALRHHASRVRRHLLRDAARRRRRGHVATAAPDRATVAAGIGRSRRVLGWRALLRLRRRRDPYVAVRGRVVERDGCAHARCSTGGATPSTR